MDVGNAPEDAVREMLVWVGRIIVLFLHNRLKANRGHHFLPSRDLIQGLSFLPKGDVAEAAAHQHEADGRQAREGCVMQSCPSFQGSILPLFDLASAFN